MRGGGLQLCVGTKGLCNQVKFGVFVVTCRGLHVLYPRCVCMPLGLASGRCAPPPCVCSKRHGVAFFCALLWLCFAMATGQGSFNWTVVETAVREGFMPDIISTDLHSGNKDGPAYDLTTARRQGEVWR